MPNHVIETDFEPDDAIAILAHAVQNKNVTLTVVVGEGKPYNKIPLVRKFFEALQTKCPDAYTSVTIVQGFGSKKGYPADDQDEVPADSEDVIKQNYTAAYASNPEAAFMMKPPREAMKLKLECKNTTVYCYGSFNWRTLKLPAQDYKDLMGRYAKFYYYDSFTAIGGKNSAMFHGETDPVNDQISSLCVKWNNLIIAECRDELAALEAKEVKDQNSIARTRKIIDNVSAGVNEQFVMADVVLFLCPQPTEQVELQDIDPYPKWIPSTTSNTYVFADAPAPPASSTPVTDERRAALMEKLEALVN
jgi:hypothetical protein